MPAKLTTESFIIRAETVHGNKYGYSQVNYINNRVKVEIICKVHGVFIQAPTDHLSGRGCSYCAGKNKTTQSFIKEASLIHGTKYDYSLVQYKTAHDFISIICKEHGIFIQKSYSHLAGKGCDSCGGTQKYNTQTFICKAKKIHRDKFDYSLVDYTLSHNRVKIICPKHGEFEQLPYTHIQGFGCAQCCDSKGEKIIKKILIDVGVDFEIQKMFSKCKDVRMLKFDFYLPKLNTCIEYDGEQHFIPITQFGGKKELLNIKRRDKIKTDYCNDNNIKLIRINYKENIEQILNALLFSWIV